MVFLLETGKAAGNVPEYFRRFEIDGKVRSCSENYVTTLKVETKKNGELTG